MIETSTQPSEYGFFRNLGQIRQALMEIKNQINTQSQQQQQSDTKYHHHQMQQQQQQQQFLSQQQSDLKNSDYMNKRARSVGQGSKRQYLNGPISPHLSQYDQYNQENERFQPQFVVQRQNFLQDQMNPQFYNYQNHQIDFDPSYSMILEHDNSLDYYNYAQHGRSAPSASQRYHLFSNHSPVPRDKSFVNNNIFLQNPDARFSNGNLNATKQINNSAISGINKNNANVSAIYDNNQSIKLSNSFGGQVKQLQDVTMDFAGDDIIELNSYNNGIHHDANISQNSMIVSKSFNENIQQAQAASVNQNSQKTSKEETLSSSIVQSKKQESQEQQQQQQQLQQHSQQQQQIQQVQSQEQQQSLQQQQQQLKEQQPLTIAERLEIKFLKQTIDQFSEDNQTIYNNFTDSLKVIEALKKKIQEQDVVIKSSYDKLKAEYIKVNHSYKIQQEQNKNLEKMVKIWKTKFEKLKESIKKGIEEELSHVQENQNIIQQLTVENNQLRELLNISYSDDLIKKVELKLDEIESDFFNNHCQKNKPPSDVEIKYMATNNKLNKEFKKFVSVEKSFQPENYFASRQKVNISSGLQFQGGSLEKISEQKALNQAQIIQLDKEQNDIDLPDDYDDDDEQDYSPPFSNTIQQQLEQKQNASNSDQKQTLTNEKSSENNDSNKEAQQNSLSSGSQSQSLNGNKQNPVGLSLKDKLSLQESSNKLQSIMERRGMSSQFEQNQKEMQSYLESKQTEMCNFVDQQQQEKVKQQQLNLLSGFSENDENFEEEEDEEEKEQVNKFVENKSLQQQKIDNDKLQKGKANKPDSLVIESDNSPEQYSLEVNQQATDYSQKAKDIGTLPIKKNPAVTNLFNNTINNDSKLVNQMVNNEDFDHDDEDDDEDYESESMEDCYGFSKQIQPQKEVIDFSDRARAKELLLQQSKQLSQQMQNPKFFKSNSSEKTGPSSNQIQQQESDLTPQQKQRQEFIKMMEKSKNTIQQNLQSNKLNQKNPKLEKFIESTKDKQEIQSLENQDKQSKEENLVNDLFDAKNQQIKSNNQDADHDNNDEQDEEDNPNNIPEEKFNIEYNDQEDDDDQLEEHNFFNKNQIQNKDQEQKITINANEIEDEEEEDDEGEDSGLQNEGEQNYDFDNLESLKKQPYFKNKNKRYAN